MQTHNLQSSKRRKHRRVGRGGKRGSFSGRGIKGQRARAGRRIRPQIRDIIKKIHKRRGYGKGRASSVNPSNIKPAILNFSDIENKFNDGEMITVELLIKKGLINTKGKRVLKVKILGKGKFIKKFRFEKNLLMSESVRDYVGKI